MSGKANVNLMRIYAYGRSYVLSSEFIKTEKLQIKMVDSAIVINRLAADEWETMTKNRTNSVMNSGSFTNVFIGYGCLGILTLPNDASTLSFHNQQQPVPIKDDSQNYLVLVKDATSVGNIKTFDMMRINDVHFLPLNDLASAGSYSQQQNVQYQNTNYSLINELKKLLCSGTFYFATSFDPNATFDITLSAQARYLGKPTNKKFLWNYNMHIPMRRLNIDTDAWLLKVICGYVEIRKVLCESRQFKVGLYSRLSTERVGTRFYCRGINDNGSCANFVETEQAIYWPEGDEELSFIQLRGSVPVFFEQPGLQVGSHRIKISRSLEACYSAFERHIESIIHDYGPSIYVLNLLGIKGDEQELSDALRRLCETTPFYKKQQLLYTNFDYHSEMKINKMSKMKVWEDLKTNFYNNDFSGAFFYSKAHGDNDSGFGNETTSNNNNGQPLTRLQRNFIRTNCMDCLDRTNNMQAYVASDEMMTFLMRQFVKDYEIRRFKEVFQSMWILSGDQISKIYTGTGAIQGRSVTQDITRSLGRALQNNLFDDTKNDCIESYLYSLSKNYAELGDIIYNLTSKTFLRLPYSVLRDLILNKREFTEQIKCRVAIGTWNVNGGFSDCDMRKVNLNDWLIDGPLTARRTGFGYLDPSVENSLYSLGDIDIFVIGFEEIVDLSAQNILNASEENATIWRKKITDFLRNQGDYVELIYENLQLVGVCLFVFVQRKHAGAIRDISVAKTKTGLGGAAGNKGGVLLRFVYYNTSLCFVCSHFAAHQKEIRQRNEDFRQIYEQSTFGGSLSTNKFKLQTRHHDYVFWCGDLNYRIDMPNDRCRALIAENKWDLLLEYDQLSIQHNEKNVFKDFHEAPISFPPTYKYNVLEDTYDRSEKCRVPAWTDRILWRRRANGREKNASPGRCLYYGRTDIRYSDHRPVSGLFEIDIDKVIPSKLMESLNKSFLKLHGSFQVVLIVSTNTNYMDESLQKQIVKLFSEIQTFCTVREYKNQLYITYSDGYFAYEAYAQFNNYHLDTCDLILNIRVENEQNYAYMIEEEIRDCISSITYFDKNLRKMSISSLNGREVKVADLLGDDEYSNESYLSIPTQLHTDILSHPNRYTDTDSVSTDSMLSNTTTLVKAHSNSNLSVAFEHSTHPKAVHSEVDLLGLGTSENSFNHHQRATSVPPKRPPPPTPARKEEQLIQIDDDDSLNNNFNTASSNHGSSNNFNSNAFGFDDDFSKFTVNDLSDINTTSQPAAPARPPPIPPLPNSKPNSNSNQNALFTLYDEPIEHELALKAAAPPSVSSAPLRPPPLPPLPTQQKSAHHALLEDIFESANKSTQQAVQAAPPLPPAPIMQPQQFNQQFVNISIAPQSSNVPPPLPPPPKIPPRTGGAQPPPVPPVPAFNSNIEMAFFNNNNNIMNLLNNNNPNNNIPLKPNINRQPPLPPPRDNHFK